MLEAMAGSDYTATSGTLTIAAHIWNSNLSDVTKQTLSNAVNATISDWDLNDY